MKIGDFSKLARISIRMLRHYDEIGLLVPRRTDPLTGYRYYSPEQLTLANRITALRDMGFSLAVMKEILTNYSDKQALKEYLELQEKQMREQHQQIKRRLLLIETTIKRLGEDEGIMNYNVVLKELPARYVVSLRDTIPTYEMEGMLWERMMKQTAQHHLQYANPCLPMAIFHDQAYKESDVDVEIQMSVQGKYEDNGDVVFKTAAPIEYVSTTFKGSYEQIAEVNEVVANWVADNGYEFNGPMFNIYHIGPATEDNPDHWLTEVCYPVKKEE
ncbi:MerR family transcriptional regulator [Bacillus xiapuensis]|uniref:MerR family transcriptional regulator n=1 Tax=Bacillus xiapuensis TaxID=2014075 RepID=UPI0018E1EE26|nr:MerR family transcriptional regulator [Bacillus xiapuensis]